VYITTRTRILITTSALALNKAVAELRVKMLGLITPYLEDVQAWIIANCAGINVETREET
jgi:maleate isomerase